jgi:uncharacterized protein YbaA (DUF1428 family)
MRTLSTWAANLREGKSMYVTGFVIPVPEDRREAYLRWAEMSAAVLKDHGCIESVFTMGRPQP